MSSRVPDFFFLYIRNGALAVTENSAGYPDNITPNFKGLFPQVLK